MKKAILIIDWEQEWVDPKSEYYIGSDLSNETAKINSLIGYGRENGYKIIFVKHIEPDGDAFKRGTSSIEFVENLNIEKNDVVIEKERISCFYETNLDNLLEGITEVIIAGILTNLCVRSAVQDAYDRDFAITVVKDCCIAFDDETHKFTLEDLKNTRPEIKIRTLDQIK